MIKTKTLFILGAGASAPFGYPTNTRLRDLIREQSQASTIIEALTPTYDDQEFYERSVNKFVEEFSRSGVYSIDFFLEHRPEFMDIGKMVIAAYLIEHENDEKLRELHQNWYMYLYDRLKTSFENFEQNKISFITFNYDRSLEQFLFEAIKNTFKKTPNECTEKLKTIPIIHLYGQLDPLPWQDYKYGRSYSPTERLLQRIQNASSNIKLISDERDIQENKAFQEAYKLTNAARRIYFLGFSFDEINLERLNIKLMKNKSINGTAFRLEKSKRRWVENYFKTKINADISLFPLDALSLLQDHLAIE